MQECAAVFSPDLLGQSAALTTAFFWAVSIVVYDRVLASVPALGANMGKAVVSFVLLAATALVLRGAPAAAPPSAWVLLLLSGALGIGLGDTALFASLNRLGPRRTLPFMLLAPPLTGLIAAVFLGERLGLAAWCGIALVVLGVGWVVTERVPTMPGRVAGLWAGVGFGLLFAASQAVGAVVSRGVLTRTGIGPLESAVPRMAGAILVLAVWIGAMRQPVRDWARALLARGLWRAFLFAAFIGSYLGIWLQQVALKNTSAGIAQTLLSTSPLFILPIAWWMGERISYRAVLGVLVAVAGIALMSGIL